MHQCIAVTHVTWWAWGMCQVTQLLTWLHLGEYTTVKASKNIHFATQVHCYAFFAHSGYRMRRQCLHVRFAVCFVFIINRLIEICFMWNSNQASSNFWETVHNTTVDAQHTTWVAVRYTVLISNSLPHRSWCTAHNMGCSKIHSSKFKHCYYSVYLTNHKGTFNCAVCCTMQNYICQYNKLT
jgi:hypothetical protein